jgi:hypothetical protein
LVHGWKNTIYYWPDYALSKNSNYDMIHKQNLSFVTN